MTPTADPRRRLLRSAVLAVAACVAVVALAAAWAFQPLPGSPAAAAAAPPPPPAVLATVDQARWAVQLWRPFADAPPPVAAPSTPLRLFSILRRGDTWIAALDPGNGNALVYARAGDAVPGATVVTVDARGVELRAGSDTSRLELER